MRESTTRHLGAFSTTRVNDAEARRECRTVSLAIGGASRRALTAARVLVAVACLLSTACSSAEKSGIVEPPPPAVHDHIPLVLQRLAGSAGNVLVSSGIPLVPGKLFRENLQY